MTDDRFATEEEAARVRALPTPFQLFRFITGSEHLHFGLWRDDDTGFATAQDRMVARLERHFPAAPRRVLDVGCGIGGTSVRLAERGAHAVGVAPEPGLIAYATALAAARGVSDRAQFHAARLQDVPLEGTEPFDLVLSQESLQYVHPLEEALARIHALTAPGGRVVIGDQVLRHEAGRELSQFHTSADIRATAAARGLELVAHEDLTAEAIPTVRRSLAALRAQRDALLAFFRDAQPAIEHDLDVCVTNGSHEADWYDAGRIGYELFAFDRA